jgi:hypothetical protein
VYRAAWIPLVAVALAAPATAQDVKSDPVSVQKAPRRPHGRQQEKALVETDRTVTITVDSRGIAVVPMYALVAKGDPLQLKVGALPKGAELEIDFISNDGRVGPFPGRIDRQNPRRGRYVLASGESYLTAGAEVVGYWKYQVIVRSPDGTDISMDPGVIIKEGL